MTQPSDRARKAAEEWSGILNHRDSEYDGDPVADLAADFATFERETPGFAAVIEQCAKCAEDEARDCPTGTIEHSVAWVIVHAIRDLTPAPPADLCADIAQKSGDAIKGQDDGR